MWIAILKKQVSDKGPKQVAIELAVSRSTVDLVCQGKYQASTKKIEAKIKAIYGHNGKVPCPVLDEITPIKCVETWQRAKKIGMMAGNPETLKLYKTCINCPVRNS